jgi:hypothetical protein
MNALTGEVGLVRMRGYLSLTPAQTWSIDWRNEDLPSLPRICSSERAGLPMLRASFYTCCCMGAPHRCCTCHTCGSLVVSDQNQIGSPPRLRMRRSVMVRSSAAKPVSWISDSLYGGSGFRALGAILSPACSLANKSAMQAGLCAAARRLKSKSIHTI